MTGGGGASSAAGSDRSGAAGGRTVMHGGGLSPHDTGALWSALCAASPYCCSSAGTNGLQKQPLRTSVR